MVRSLSMPSAMVSAIDFPVGTSSDKRGLGLEALTVMAQPDSAAAASARPSGFIARA
jgi:hypothetical protein